MTIVRRALWVRRFCWITATVAALAATVAGLVLLQINTQLESFVPRNDPSVVALEDQARSFGADPIVVLLQTATPGALFDTKVLSRVVGLEGQLSQLPDVAVVYGPGTLLNQIAAEAQGLISRIAGRRDPLQTVVAQRARDAGDNTQSQDSAVTRSTSDFDRRYGSLLVQALPAGLPTLRNPAFVRTVIFNQVGQVRPQWRFVIPSANSVALLVRPREHLGQNATALLVTSVHAVVDAARLPVRQTTVTGLPSVTTSLADSVEREIPILGGAAVVAIALCFGLMPDLGSWRRRFLPLLVAIVSSSLLLAGAGWLRLPLSLGVVAFLPVLFSITSYYPLYLASTRPRRRVGVAAVASGASFASMSLSRIPFVRELGLTLAAGVLVAVLISTILLRLSPDAVVASEEPDRGPPPPSIGKGKRIAALAVLATISAGGWLVLPRVGIQADPLELASGLDALKVAQNTERVLGSSGDISIVLRGPDVMAPAATLWSREADVAEIQAHGDVLRPIVTLPEVFRFLGDNPTQQQIDAATQIVPQYLSGAVLSDDRKQSLLLYGLTLRNLGPQPLLLRQIREALPPAPRDISQRWSDCQLSRSTHSAWCQRGASMRMSSASARPV